LNINWEKVRSDSNTSIRLTHTKQTVIDSFQTEPDNVGNTPIIGTAFFDLDRNSNRTDIEIVQIDEIDESLRFVYGANLRKDRVKSFFLANDKIFHDINSARLFTGVEWRLNEHWILDFGTTVEDSSITDQEYSPRFSILRKLNKNQIVRFVASRAKRNPILYEHSGLSVFDVNASIPGAGNIDFDFKTYQGNPNIQPEDIVSYEIGLRTVSPINSISSDVKLFSYEITGIIGTGSFQEGHPFLSDLASIISGTPTTIELSVDTAENERSAIIKGIELAFDWEPTPSFDIKSGFSYVSSDSESAPVEDSFPDTTAFLLSRYQWQKKHSLSASLYYIDEMEWLGRGSKLTSINKLDLRYAYILDEASETQIELIGQNLLGEYPDYFVENISERIYLLRISGSF